MRRRTPGVGADDFLRLRASVLSLLPAFGLFFPVDTAVASTAVVHFLNGVFKIVLIGRNANLRIVVQFGVPVILAALAGAWLLVRLSGMTPIATYRIAGLNAEITFVKIVIGLILAAFAFSS